MDKYRRCLIKCEDLIFLLNKEEHTLQIWYQNSKLFLTVVNYNKTSELATLYSLHFMQDEILQNYFLCKIQIRLYSTVYFNCNETELFIFCITSNSSLIFLQHYRGLLQKASCDRRRDMFVRYLGYGRSRRVQVSGTQGCEM